jgi:hypothetical protein
MWLQLERLVRALQHHESALLNVGAAVKGLSACDELECTLLYFGGQGCEARQQQQQQQQQRRQRQRQPGRFLPVLVESTVVGLHMMVTIVLQHS